MAAQSMSAWRVRQPGPMTTHPLDRVTVDVPQPAPGELLVAVHACGVCRTDLHVTEGDLPVHRPGVIPGHEVVGEVAGRAPTPATSSRSVTASASRGCGTPVATADSASAARRISAPNHATPAGTPTVATPSSPPCPADYAHHLPVGYSDTELAPLLCAGIIGYRSLLRADLPPGGRLGIYGFGGSAHLTAQVALAQGAEVHVMTRGERARELALSLGAASAQGAADPPPVPFDSAILFAPVGDLVPPALEALDRGGTLAVAGIYLSDIPALNYERHLFQERQVRSVTSNTRDDAREFLAFAGQHHIDVTSPEYPLGRADAALSDLSEGRIAGAAVLLV